MRRTVDRTRPAWPPRPDAHPRPALARLTADAGDVNSASFFTSLSTKLDLTETTDERSF